MNDWIRRVVCYNEFEGVNVWVSKWVRQGEIESLSQLRVGYAYESDLRKNE